MSAIGPLQSYIDATNARFTELAKLAQELKVIAMRIASITPAVPPALPTSTPFTGTPIAIPGTFTAKNFDLGGEGIAYHDNVPGNEFGEYRPSEDVDIRISADLLSGGFEIANTETGEWLIYTIKVAATAQYDIELRASNNNWSPPPRFHAEIDGVNVTGSVTVPSTGDWGIFAWIGKKTIALTAGIHLLKIVVDQQYFGLSAIRIVNVGVVSAPTITLSAVSDTIVSGQSSTLTWSSAGATSVTASVGWSGAKALSGSEVVSPVVTTLYTLDCAGAGGSASTSATVTVTPASGLLFSSGYESPVVLAAPSSFFGTGAYQSISGQDGVGSWPLSLPGWGAGPTHIQSLVDATVTASTIGNFINNRIEAVTGHGGGSTKALYQEVIQRGGSQGITQSSLQFQPSSEGGDLYISLWMKLQPDFYAKMNPQSWRSLVEWKTAGDYRLKLEIPSYEDGCAGVKPNGQVAPFWRIAGDNNANGGLPFEVFWQVDNCSLLVPAGQWFKIELFWHRTHGTDSRVWVAIDGTVIFDVAPVAGVAGCTRTGLFGVNNAAINRIFLGLCYAGHPVPIYQWTDQLEIWDSFPPSNGSNPPYAPH